MSIPSQPANFARLTDLQDYMAHSNPQDSWLQFKLALFSDLVTIGWAAVEIEKDGQGNVANLWTLDAAKIYIDFDEQGIIQGYDMLDAWGMPIHGPDGTHAWLPDEVIFYRLNPVTYSRYPATRIYQLYSLGVIEDMMMAFIGTKFTESNIPFGMLARVRDGWHRALKTRPSSEQLSEEDEQGDVEYEEEDYVVTLAVPPPGAPPDNRELSERNTPHLRAAVL